MTLRKGIAPFHAIAELKQREQLKNFILQIQKRKGTHQIVKGPTTSQLISSIVKAATIWTLSSFLTMFHFPSFTVLKTTNGS